MSGLDLQIERAYVWYAGQLDLVAATDLHGALEMLASLTRSFAGIRTLRRYLTILDAHVTTPEIRDRIQELLRQTEDASVSTAAFARVGVVPAKPHLGDARSPAGVRAVKYREKIRQASLRDGERRGP